MDTRSGYKISAVLKAGIKVEPIGMGYPGTISRTFKIKVSKKSKSGKEIEVKGSGKIYPEKKDENGPGVYEKIDQIYDYYYNRITKNQK